MGEKFKREYFQAIETLQSSMIENQGIKLKSSDRRS
jgi:hypothetical protein